MYLLNNGISSMQAQKSEDRLSYVIQAYLKDFPNSLQQYFPLTSATEKALLLTSVTCGAIQTHA